MLTLFSNFSVIEFIEDNNLGTRQAKLTYGISTEVIRTIQYNKGIIIQKKISSRSLVSTRSGLVSMV